MTLRHRVRVQCAYFRAQGRGRPCVFSGIQLGLSLHGLGDGFRKTHACPLGPLTVYGEACHSKCCTAHPIRCPLQVCSQSGFRVHTRAPPPPSNPDQTSVLTLSWGWRAVVAPLNTLFNGSPASKGWEREHTDTIGRTQPLDCCLECHRVGRPPTHQQSAGGGGGGVELSPRRPA